MIGTPGTESNEEGQVPASRVGFMRRLSEVKGTTVEDMESKERKQMESAEENERARGYSENITVFRTGLQKAVEQALRRVGELLPNGDESLGSEVRRAIQDVQVAAQGLAEGLSTADAQVARKQVRKNSMHMSAKLERSRTASRLELKNQGQE